MNSLKMKFINKYLLFSLLMFLATGSVVAQTLFSYSNGNVERKKGFRFGTSTTQGLAIYLPAEKAAMLKGAKITGIKSAFGTSQLSNMKAFVTTSLGGEPMYTCPISGAATTLKEFAFSNPVEITGEALYIGYTFEVAETYSPLLFDMSVDTKSGLSWAYEDGKWIDVSRMGNGAANIFLILEGAQEFTDLMIKPISIEPYLKAGVSIQPTGQVYNLGTTTLNSFTISCYIGGGEVSRLNVENVEIKQGECYDFRFPEVLSNESGDLAMRTVVGNLNGSVLDLDVTDNEIVDNVYLYPSDMERKVLIEFFTGQSCPNCPAGHNNLASATQGLEDEFVEVTHHVGYNPDFFSMSESTDYLWFYGGSTYAPGLMFNRTPIESGLTSPVFDGTRSTNHKTAVSSSLNTEPYVSVKMYNEFNADTRQGVVTVDVHTYRQPSDEVHALNVHLTQNGIVANQSSAGTNYVHNHVFRGSLTGVWGEEIPLVVGETVRKSYSYSIPDSIFATYYDSTTVKPSLLPNYKFEAVPANMELVAFVSDNTMSNLTCKVYNAASIGVTTYVDGVDTPSLIGHPEVSFLPVGNGIVQLAGQYSRIEVYNITGRVRSVVPEGTLSVMLPAGMYVARVVGLNGQTSVSKFVVK